MRSRGDTGILFARVLKHTIKIGRLTLIDATGKTHVFQGEPGPAHTIRLHNRSLHWRLLTNPKLAFGEAWMNDEITCEDGTIYDVLDLLGQNLARLEQHPSQIWREKLGRIARFLHGYNPAPRARRNVAHHYDLSGALYDLFLDKDRQYSCAYFEPGNTDLEEAQLAKKRHIAAKLALRPGQRVLDIGSGWGGMGLYLGRIANVEVTGVTLSEE